MADSFPTDTARSASYFATPRRKALIVALLVLAALVGIWWGGHDWYRNRLLAELRGEVLAELDPYGNALTIDLSRRFDLIYGLGAWVSGVSSMTELSDRFVPFARQLSESVAGVRALAVAPDGVVKLVFPRAGNEGAIGHNNLQDPRDDVRADVARAIGSRKIVISGPYEMVVGGFGATARLAIYRDDKFWGLIHVALDIPPILAEARITSQTRFQLALRDGRGRIFFGDKSIFDDAPVIHRVGLPDGHWDLAAIPAAGWRAAIRRDLWIFDAGVLASVLFASAIAYLLAYRDARLAARVAERTVALDDELSRRGVIERQLRAAQERYHGLVAVNPDAVFVNQDQRIVFANPAAARLLGANSAEELLGRSPFDFVPPESHEDVEKRYRLAVATGRPNEPKVQPRVRLDGTLVYVESVAAALPWEGGTAVQVILRDLTEQRKAERSLQELIETAQDSVVSIDRQAHIVMFNAAAERVFGYTKSEVVGKRVNLLMAEPYASEHDGYIARYEATGEARAIGRIRTLTARRKSGEAFPIELSVTKLASGPDTRYTAFIRDISDKVRLQQQAVENERLATIGTMAAKFGHELGNPLNGMSLTIQLLEQRLGKQLPEPDQQVTATLVRLKSEIARLNTLLQDFRSLSRKEIFNFQPVSLAELVAEAIEIELPHYAERGVKVECDFAADLPSVRADVDKLKQVILNLAKNAVEAMPQGGKLRFAGSANGASVTLEVTDTGAGIPTEVDIFEPFFTTKSFGTGIGMTIVRQILAAHGGAISYKSQVGQGTTFTLQLPLAE